MKVIVRGVHIDLTRGLKRYVFEHLVRPIERFYDSEAAEVDVHLCDTNGPKGGLDKECRVTVFMPRLPAIHITEASEDLYKCIDLARDRLERIAKKHLGKRRSPGKKIYGRAPNRSFEMRMRE
jgi:ribosomal subunit interface protein